MTRARSATGVSSTRFHLLWAGSGVSELGTAVSNVALPLLALGRLHASALDVGLLAASGNIGWLLIGLPVGSWMGRWDKRRALVVADLARAVLLGSVPLAWWAGWLSVAWLIAVSFVAGLFSVVFNVGWPSYLPEVVQGEDATVAANSRLTTTTQAGDVLGPGLGGLLVQYLSAGGAVGLDALSFVWSACCVARTGRRPGPDATAATSATPARRGRLRSEVADGFRVWWRDPLLRRFSLYSTQVALFVGIFNAVVFLFLERRLHLDAGVIGALMAASGFGGVVGALWTPRIRSAIGSVRTLQLGAGLVGLGGIAVPLTGTGAGLTFFVVGFAVATAGLVTFNIIGGALRQTRVPPTHLARVVSSTRLLSWGVVPVGSLLGGGLATVWSPRDALWVVAAGWVLALGWLGGTREEPCDRRQAGAGPPGAATPADPASPGPDPVLTPAPPVPSRPTTPARAGGPIPG